VADVLVRYFASAAEAAGRDEELVPAVATVGQLRAVLVDSYGDAMILLGMPFGIVSVVGEMVHESIGAEERAVGVVEPDEHLEL